MPQLQWLEYQASLQVHHVNDTEVRNLCSLHSQEHSTASAFIDATPLDTSLQVSRRAISQDFLDGSGQLPAVPAVPAGRIPTAFDDSWITWAKSNPLLVLGVITPVFSIAAAALTGIAGLFAASAATSEAPADAGEGDDGEGMFGDFGDFDLGDWGGDDE
mmetsp:Transcript_49801/g.79370  ORF Transcript_49801/g.79370 Transcript_49801/m.79370 type:complete len:160 (-) Transcript_49801:71-550(-)